MTESSWVEISRRALRENFRQFRQLLRPSVAAMAVVKANAYGHGLLPAAQTFAAAGADWLGVANDAEAFELVRAGIRRPILILSYFTSNEDRLRALLRKKVRFPISRLEDAALLSTLARRLRLNAFVHVKVDTGASRLGFLPAEGLEKLQAIKRLPNLVIEGIFSHFAESENPDQRFTNLQLDRFQHFLTYAAEQGVVPRLRHIACSASTLLNPPSWMNLVRLGISLYGLISVEKVRRNLRRGYPKLRLHPALSWKTKVLLLKTIPKGETIGYGRTFRARKTMRVATLPIGYYEGYDRRLSNCGVVLIHGQRCPIVGRISMNVTVVNVSRLRKVSVGDEVVLLGRQGRGEVSADEIAATIGTIHYEVLSRINPELPRSYV